MRISWRHSTILAAWRILWLGVILDPSFFQIHLNVANLDYQLAKIKSNMGLSYIFLPIYLAAFTKFRPTGIRNLVELTPTNAYSKIRFPGEREIPQGREVGTWHFHFKRRCHRCSVHFKTTLKSVSLKKQYLLCTTVILLFMLLSRLYLLFI